MWSVLDEDVWGMNLCSEENKQDQSFGSCIL